LHASIFIVLISSDAPFAEALMHLHHTGSQTESPVVVPEEPEEQLEVQPQEVTEADKEDVEELPECPDHRPSSFERGKLRSISLPWFAIIN
jgi:hypothetical protein